MPPAKVLNLHLLHWYKNTNTDAAHLGVVAVADVQLEEKAFFFKKRLTLAHLDVVAVPHIVLLEEEVAVGKQRERHRPPEGAYV